MIQIIKKNLDKTVKLDDEGRPMSRFRYIPIVDSEKKKNLLYMVKLEELQQICEEYLGPINASSEEE